MKIKRIVRHWLTTQAQVRRAFPVKTLEVIEQAIKASEGLHEGEIRFVVEAALDGWPLFRNQPARERALEVFSQLRIWDTEHNSGLLIYLLMADHAVEIVADRGIHARVGAHEWEAICHRMEAAFRQSDFEGGVLAGVQAVTGHLTAHFPAQGRSRNELPNQPLIM